jgi:hypothetical protein
MDSDQAAIFIIISIAFAFFIWGRWRYDLVAMMALLTSVIAGVVPWSQAFSGFAHPAVIIFLPQYPDACIGDKGHPCPT